MNLVFVIVHIIVISIIFFSIIGWYICLKRSKYYQKEKPKSAFNIKLEKIEKKLDKIREKNDF